jgi:MFS family permease
MCNGFIKSFPGLCVCRLILGFLEGCLFPSMTLLLANWYLREELGTRISYLFSKQDMINLWEIDLTLFLQLPLPLLVRLEG